MDFAKSKATAERLLGKVSSQGTVSKKADVLDQADLTQSVRAFITNRVAEPDQPVKCNAIISATSFPLEGSELVLNGIAYDVVKIEQTGVGDNQIIQRAVLHEK